MRTNSHKNVATVSNYCYHYTDTMTSIGRVASRIHVGVVSACGIMVDALPPPAPATAIVSDVVPAVSGCKA